MSEKEVSYLHIVPFDLGYAFWDILNLDNSKNLRMTEEFLDKISLFCEQNNYHAVRTFSLKKDQKKIYGYKCNDDIVDKSICRIRLKGNLYVFLLLSGLGSFVILDDDTACLEDINVQSESEIFRINYIKRKSQKAILSGQINDKEAKAFSEERKLMKLFMSKCWEILRLVSRKYREHLQDMDKRLVLCPCLDVFLLLSLHQDRRSDFFRLPSP